VTLANGRPQDEMRATTTCQLHIAVLPLSPRAPPAPRAAR
jgi:hypothetical protein